MTQPDGGQPNMNDILAQAQAMQQQLEQAQEKIMQSFVVGEAGGGLVKVTMYGTGKVSEVHLDPKVVDPEDIDTLQDLLVGAYDDAHRKIAAVAEQYMKPVTPDFGGADLSDILQGFNG